MGLDVYVGTLTRYHLRDWETITQQRGREAGIPVRVLYTDEGEEGITNPDEVREVVMLWRKVVNRSLAPHLGAPLDWDESDGLPYFTDKPDWNGYWALRLWAAHAEHPGMDRPAQVPEEPHEDGAFVASRAAAGENDFWSLLRDVELWLPADFSVALDFEAPNGKKMQVGSSVELQRQLRELNKRTWKAEEERIAGWHDGEEGERTPLENEARFGMSIFWDLVRKSIDHRLPMILDY